MTETPTTDQGPPTRWFWQRRLQYRLMLAFGLLFLIVLTLLMLYVLDIVYETQLSQAEHDLEIESFLIANALEDPLSGYAVEFEDHDGVESEDDHSQDDHSGDTRRNLTTANIAKQPAFPKALRRRRVFNSWWNGTLMTPEAV